MNRVLIIAEAGVNHNGNLDTAKELIEVAAIAGADYVKFQTFKTELNITKEAKKAIYQEKSTGKNESQYDMVKKLELSYDNFLILKKHCELNKISFLSTGFDFPSLNFLDSLNPSLYKIPSGEITNLLYLRKVASFQKPVILSTGMANMIEIRNSLDVLLKEGLSKKQITILHCNTEYPTPMEDVNLKAMNTIGKELDVKVGYSDHTLGIEVPIAAVALGASVIEKHFTLDRNMPGPDHRASLEPQELKQMVNAIRNIEKAIAGSGFKEPSQSEIKNKAIARKSIHIAMPLKAGETIQLHHLVMKRPGDGISPMNFEQLVGKKAARDLVEEEKLNWTDITA